MSALEGVKRKAAKYAPRHKALRRSLRGARADRVAEGEWFRALLEYSTDGVVLMTSNGRLLYASPSTTRILGYSVEEFLAAAPFELVHPDDVESATERLATLLAEPESISKADVRIQHKDGSWLRVETTSRNLLARPGIHAIAVNYHDLTERKKAEDALHEAHQQALSDYRQLLDRLAGLEQKLGTSEDLTSVFRGLLDFLLASVPCNGLLVSMYNHDLQDRTCVYAWSDGDEEDVSKLPPLPMTDSPNSRAVSTGQIVVTDDFQAVMAGRPHVNLGLDRDPRLPASSIVVPMSVMGKVIGAFEVQSVELAAYRQEHLTAVQMAANIAAIATENVRLLEGERQARMEAEASSMHLQELVQGLNAIIWEGDAATGRLSFVSQQAETLLGYPVEQWLTEEGFWPNHILPEDQKQKYFQNVASNTDSDYYTNEYRMVAADGMHVWIRDVVHVIRGASGQPKQLRGVMTDVTEQKRAEEDLRRSEELFATAFRASPDAFIITRLSDNVLLDVNDSFSAIIGYSRDEAIGKPITDLNIWADLSERDRMVARLRVDGSVNNFEAKYKTKSGDMGYGLISAEITQLGGEPCMLTICRDVTERKLAEQALRDSEERYRVITETAKDVIISIDEESNILFVNQAVEEIFGYTVAEVVGESVTMLMPHKMRENHNAGIERYVRTGLKRKDWNSVQVEGLHKGGTEVPLEITFADSLADGKRIFIGTMRDITERKQAEWAQAESFSLLRATLESTADGILVVDSKGTIRNFNQKFTELWGLPDSVPASTDDTQAMEFVLDQLIDPEGFSRKAQELYDQPDADSFDILDFKDGRTFERYSRPQKVGDRSVGRVWSFRDVTERKQAAEALQESESKYRTIIEQASEGFFLADAKGKLIDVNEMACEMLSYTRDEVLMLSIGDIVEITAPEVTQARVMELVAGKTVRTEHLMYRKDGTAFPAESSTKFLPGGLFQGFVRDTTERKQAEEALMKAKADLEVRVAERTAELSESNDQLQHELTERLRAEKALQQSEEQFRAIFEHAPVMIDSFTEDGRCILWNAECEKQLGYTKEEMLAAGDPLLLFYPDAKVRDRVLEATDLSDGEFREYSVRASNGTSRDQMWAYFTLPNKNLISIGYDITEHKVVEQALFDSEQRYRQMFQGNRSVQLLVDPSTCSIVEANPAASRFYGYSIEELKQMKMMDIDLSLHNPEESKIGHLAPGESPVLVLQHKLSSGEMRDVELHLSPVDIAGRHLRYIIVHDITNRKLAETMLRRSEELHRALARNLPKGAVLLFDTDLRFQLAEGAALVTQGYSKESLIGKTVWEILPPEIAEVLVPYYRAALAGEEKIIEREFSGHYYVMHFIPVKDDHGETFAGMVVSLDITEQKRSAEEARLAQEAAEQANKAKSEFLSRMSHELRTPLNAIIGFSQLLEMDALEPEQRDSVGLIHNAGRQLLALINEVLEISRIEAGHMLITTEPVPVSDIMEECINLMRPMAAEKSLLVKADTNSKIFQPNGHVMADRQRMKQVLLNLLANGIKYNREGGSVVLSYREVHSGRVRIEVTDTGPGIPQEKLEKLFIPFERLGADQAGIEGTGLGLAVSRRLAELMGGAIGVESVVGQGCTFWLELPVAAALVDQAKRELTGPLALPQGPLPVTKMLLYIEDNLSNLLLIEQILRHRPDIQMLSAMQGRLGFDLATQHLPDLILLDLHLPDVHGEKVLEWLRQDHRTKDIPVVIISADATPREIGRLLDLGANTYITKPINVKQFVTVINDAFEQKEITSVR